MSRPIAAAGQDARLAARGWVLVVSLALAGCGGHHAGINHVRVTRSTSVDVYASVPLHGPRAQQAAGVLNGIKLALGQAHGRAGRWRIHLTTLDDSTPASRGWDAGRTAQNARTAASDPAAVYYIGELDSAASEVSGPILNAAGVPQVSPLSTYPGLTSGSPPPVDPTRIPTFLRLVPSDSVQAAALLEAARGAHCARAAVLHDDTLEGAGLAAQLEAKRAEFGVQITSDQRLKLAEQNPPSYAAGVKTEAARCLIFAGGNSTGAARLLSTVATADHLLEVLGSDGVCTASFTNPAVGGLSPAAATIFKCTSPAGDLDSSAAGRAFLAAYAAAYHTTPDPLAAYGYEAMSLALDTISGLGVRGDDKGAVRSALFAIRDRHSLIGTYGFDRNGDSTARSYGLYRVGRNGVPTLEAELRP